MSNSSKSVTNSTWISRPGVLVTKRERVALEGAQSSSYYEDTRNVDLRGKILVSGLLGTVAVMSGYFGWSLGQWNVSAAVTDISHLAIQAPLAAAGLIYVPALSLRYHKLKAKRKTMLLAEDLRPAPASENYLDTLTKLYYKVLKTYNRNIELDPSVQADTQLDLHLLLWDIAGCVMDRQALIGIPDHILTLDQKQARKEALEEITAVEEVLTKRAETLLALITQAVNAQEAVGGKNAIIQAAHERAKALRDETHPGIAGPLLETYTQTILGLSGQKAANKSLTATDETAQ